MYKAKMNDKRFGRKVRRMARRKVFAGRMSQADREKLNKATSDPVWLAEARKQVERIPSKPWSEGKYITGFEWATVWEWFSENWEEILAMLLKIIPLFMGENDENTGTSPTL